MSSSAISLIVNDGKADRLIFGADFLKRRIGEIRNERIQRGMTESEQYPSVAEIARTHIVFMNSSYKLHVPTVVDYSKLIPNSTQGPLQAANTQIVSFRLNNTTEYVADCVFDISIGSISNNQKYMLDSNRVNKATWVVTQGDGTPVMSVKAGELNVSTDQLMVAKTALLLDHFTEDQLGAEVKMDGVKTVVYPWTADVLAAALVLRASPAGTPVYDGTVDLNFRGNVERPVSETMTIKLLFDHAYVMNGQYVKVDEELPAEHAPYGRWFDFPGHRLVRQSTFSIAGNEISKYYSDDYSILEKTRLTLDKRDQYHKCVGQGVRKTAKGATNGDLRMDADMFEGPQVPKPFPLAPQRFYIPSLHWFNKLEHALPVGNLSSQNLELQFELNGLNDLVAVVPAPINRIKIAKTLRCNAPEDVDKEVITEPITMDDYRVVNGVSASLRQGDLSTNFTNYLVYSCNLTVDPNFAEVLTKRTQFQLIRLLKTQTIGINKSSDSQLQVNDLRLPTEFFLIGARSLDQKVRSDPDLWHKFCHVEKKVVEKRMHVDVNHQVVDRSLEVVNDINMFKTFGCKAFGYEIFRKQDLTPAFYSNYLPMIRGTEEFPSFKDGGLMLLPFALLPGKHQPSGHLNLTRTNTTFNFDYESDYIGSVVPNVEIVVNSSVLNFLLIVGHAAVLRFH